MGIGTRLEELMKLKGTNANELANKIGATPSTIYSIIKRDSNRVDIDIIIKIAHALDMSADDFLSYKIDEESDPPFVLTAKETELIKKYRALDSYGAKAVGNVLEIEYDRCLASASLVMDNLRPIRYYQRVASAGSGQVVFDGLPADFVYVPCTDEYHRVAYAVGVNGDSMEPDFSDGDILLVEPTTDLRIGEIGIFYTDGYSYVKELGYGELISLNPDYGPIQLNEESRCMGRVIGKL